MMAAGARLRLPAAKRAWPSVVASPHSVVALPTVSPALGALSASLRWPCSADLPHRLRFPSSLLPPHRQQCGASNNTYFGYNKHTYAPPKAEGKNEFAPDFEKAKIPGCTSGDNPEEHLGTHGQFFEYIPPEVAKIKRVDGAGQKAIFEVREGGNDTKFEWPEGTRPEKGANGQCFPSGPKKLYTSPAKKGTYGMLGTNIGAFGAGDNQLGRPTEMNDVASPYDEAQRVHRAERGPNTT